MDKFIIHGGKHLKGSVRIGGAKNASLALMPASLLADGPTTLTNSPRLRDVNTMGALLQTMGVAFRQEASTVIIDPTGIRNFEAPYEHVKKMRASIYVLGPLLARHGYAKVSLPGGCAWGPRPVNLHIEGLKRLGADIRLEGGYIIAKAPKLKGNRILFDISSVGATGNILMAAVLAEGVTKIENAAMEPEITALANFLVTMGAKIRGIGTGRLEIEGVRTLKPITFETIPDRIEAGTFLVAAAMAGTPGKAIRIGDCRPDDLGSVLTKLEDVGCGVNTGDTWVDLTPPETIAPVDVTTGIFPGFPTDMQAQWIALMLKARGTSVVTDRIYVDRFMHVPELQRLGALITVQENSATVEGVQQLSGAKVMSTDLRASASLILAGLVAEGTTEVLRVYHIDRGYERIEEKLLGLGADIRRASGEEF